MQAQLGHIQVNVTAENLPFYRDLASFLGLSTVYEDESMLGVGGPNNASIWYIGANNGAQNDYDGPGMNHIGLQVTNQADIDAAAAWLRERNVEPLFETPRHRPDFGYDENSTYYQVMFESPDRVLFEVVYIGPKS
jgi:catechol 2,3-dioxygenase-like lactoylglutathione lyase family enzyme